MNIVYLLTNTSKAGGKRFYIGSKTECQIVDVGGVPTIIGREGKPYYSSASSFEFKEDMLRGDVISASLLEEVPDKKKLLQAENSWIDKSNAVFSDEYYNMSNAVLNCHNQDAIANLYGESVKELANRNSSLGKRDNSAKDLGYSNFGELCFDIWERYSKNNNWNVVSSSFGKERHWAQVVIKMFDMNKAKTDLEKATSEQVRELVGKKCSLFKAAEILGIEIPTARVLLGDFNKVNQKGFTVALLLGKTQGELEADITRDVLLDIPWRDITKKYGVNETSARRYFMRCIKRHLSPEDISDQIYETEEDILDAKKNRKTKQKRMADFKKEMRLVVSIPQGENIQANNKSGVNGVHSTTSKNGVLCWVAKWTDFSGKPRSKQFSTNVHGEAAFKMACDYREKMFESAQARLRLAA